MSDGAHRVAPHHPELVNVPVRVVGLVQDGHLGTQSYLLLVVGKLMVLILKMIEVILHCAGT